MTVELTAAGLIEAARALAPAIRACADEIERERRLPEPLVRAIAAAGLFRLFTPRALGGGEVDPLTRMRVCEELARADASAAWVVETATATAYLIGGWLREDAARGILCHTPDVITGGAIGALKGRATVVDGGYQVSGRWPWGSGSRHHAWTAGACAVYDGETPRMRDDGTAATRILIFPTSDVDIIDTWTSTGLRGSGSHDYAVHDLFVPAARSLSVSEPPVQTGPLYRFAGVYVSGPGALALGVARAAIDTLTDLAGAKIPTRSRSLLRERATVQLQVAEAEALAGSARAYLYETVSEVWETVRAGDQVEPRQRARFRLAITHAVLSAVRAVDLMYTAGGGTSVYATSPLDRQFRDIHTIAQHGAWAQPTLQPAGRMLLGLDPESPGF